MRFMIIVAGLVLGLTAPVHAQRGWRLVWSDEFNGASGSTIDQRKWSAQIGGSGWGNQELEYYTASPGNAHLNGRGSLVITALQERLPQTFTCWYGPCQYTSARLFTKNKFAQADGRFEARIKLPSGQGMWPAFWLLGENIDSVGWPACGEIDVMEQIGREPSVVHGTIHGPGYSGGNGIGAAYSLPPGQRFADDYHIFAVEWEPKAMRWYVDGNLYLRLRGRS